MKSINKTWAMIICCIFLSGFSPMASAGFTQFIKLDGIDGEIEDSAHPGWIELLSIEWSMEAADTDKRGSSGEISDIKITVAADASSPYLALACMDGTHFPTVDFDFVDESGEVVRTLRLSDVKIQSMTSTSRSNSDVQPSETWTLSYTRIQWTAYPSDHEQPPAEFVWKRASSN